MQTNTWSARAEILSLKTNAQKHINPPVYQQKHTNALTASVNDLLSDHYFLNKQHKWRFQITFLCIISVRNGRVKKKTKKRNGSVCKEMSEKWGQQKKKKRRATKRKKTEESSSEMKPLKCHFPPQKNLNNRTNHIWFAYCIYTTQPLSLSSISPS